MEICESTVYGAATIVNAISTGRGAAFGIRLQTRARARIIDEPGLVKCRIIDNADESTGLIKEAASLVLRRSKKERVHGLSVETESDIPIGRGLKSSSAAANAVVLACAGILGLKLSDYEILNMAVDAALQAKVTITGAYDDACASYYGSIIATDNTKRKILRKYSPEKNLVVVVHVPPEKRYTVNVDVQRIKLLTSQVAISFREVLKGNYWSALTLNGIIHSAVLGESAEPALEALEAGAVAAGLSGKGPATVAVATQDKADDIQSIWRQRKGNVIRTGLNTIKASIKGRN